MATADDDLDPSVFLQRIRQLGEQRDQEDAARLAQLESDILQGRSERLLRRAGTYYAPRKAGAQGSTSELLLGTY